MRVDVVTVFAPRRDHEKWTDTYFDLLALQRLTCQRFGHRHVVVSDEDIPGFETYRTSLPAPLMQAQLAGQVAWLKASDYSAHTVLVDADVLVARDLTGSFDGSFDLGLTFRVGNAAAPINNGAMYIAADAVRGVTSFFQKALGECGTHWGADQEAISRQAMPVPEHAVTVNRNGIRLAYLGMATHNAAPKRPDRPITTKPFVIHFKGEDAKNWAGEFARRYGLAD